MINSQESWCRTGCKGRVFTGVPRLETGMEETVFHQKNMILELMGFLHRLYLRRTGINSDTKWYQKWCLSKDVEGHTHRARQLLQSPQAPGRTVSIHDKILHFKALLHLHTNLSPGQHIQSWRDRQTCHTYVSYQTLSTPQRVLDVLTTYNNLLT